MPVTVEGIDIDFPWVENNRVQTERDRPVFCYFLDIENFIEKVKDVVQVVGDGV